ncbi:MAG: Rrf2 family transcriptional regulator [Spirochaetia bacterium]|jgi:Rrf2 family protein|nr:Rrf2 family transcriptional regulator [Spirochaetia bacterium]
MKISTKGRYALRLMLDLAEHNTGEFITLKDISVRQEISVKYLEQIVIQLSKAGMLKSLRGSQGGYRLAKNPAEYTVGTILRTTEGNLAPVTCLETEKNECPRASGCETLDFWKGLSKVIADYVDSTTLDELRQSCKEQVTYEI